MQVGLFAEPGVIEVTNVDDPKCASDEAIVQVARCGVCGTDRSIFRGEYPVEAPIVLGHEYSGTVVEVGADVDNLKVGDRVAVDPNVVDGNCFFCRRGLSNLCSGLTPLGVVRSGGFAEFSAVPGRYLYMVPDAMSFAEASLVEPLACCVRGIDQANVSAGDVVAILGTGPIGCFLVQLARLRGAGTVMAVEPNESRHDFALLAGADVVCFPDQAKAMLELQRGRVGADVVIEASGQIEAASAAFDLVRRGGTVLLFGVYPQDRVMFVSPFRINEDELRVVGSLNNPNTHARAIDLLASGRVSTEGIVSDVLALKDVALAMDVRNFSAPGKVTIDLLVR